MAQTEHYKLYVEDSGETTFQEWRRAMNGPDDSNMTKIEDALLEKQDKLTTGDGMSIQDGTISVATPVKGVFSQEEFDALPEEQRNRGMYIIPDGGGSSGGGLTLEGADRRYVQLDDTVPIRGDVYLTDGNLSFEGLGQAPLYKLEALYIRANMRTRAPKARESSTLLRRRQDFHRTTSLRRAPQSDTRYVEIKMRRSNYEHGVATARCICPCWSGDCYPSGYQTGGVCPEGCERDKLGQGAGYGHEIHGNR